MRLKLLTPLLLVASLSSCTQTSVVIEGTVFCFDTAVSYKLYEGTEDDKKEIEDLLSYYDKISDNYKKRGEIKNICTINETNEPVKIDDKLYQLLKTSFSINEIGATNFNPLCGSLAKAWKESLAKKELLSEETIKEGLDKINNSSLEFKEDNVVQRLGEAEIDLGGIAKGYVLDEIYDYLSSKDIKHYLINGGSSSILLGEKDSGDGYFNVGIDARIIPNSYLKLKNCFVSTSAISVQGVQIEEGGPIYSHIVNPKTGSVLNEQEAVIVVSSKGYVGDALSTSMMMNTVEEIKAIEKEQNVKCIVFNDKKVSYIHTDLEVLKR